MRSRRGLEPWRSIVVLRTQGPISRSSVIEALPHSHRPAMRSRDDGELRGARYRYDAPMTKILIVNPNTTASMTETIGAAARAVAAPGTEISRRDLGDGAGLDRGLLRRGVRRARPDPGAAECAGRRCGDRRVFRRYRPRRRADRRALPGGRHLRGGAGDGGADRKTHRHRHHAAALDRAAARNWCAATVLRSGRGSPPATSRCSISKSPARARKRNSRPRLPARSTRARKRSCSAARGWPISRKNCRDKFGVPVVDGVAAAVKQAEALAGLNLTTSRRGSYASPGVKKYDGLLAPFAPKTSG